MTCNSSSILSLNKASFSFVTVIDVASGELGGWYILERAMAWYLPCLWAIQWCRGLAGACLEARSPLLVTLQCPIIHGHSNPTEKPKFDQIRLLVFGDMAEMLNNVPNIGNTLAPYNTYIPIHCVLWWVWYCHHDGNKCFLLQSWNTISACAQFVEHVHTSHATWLTALTTHVV